MNNKSKEIKKNNSKNYSWNSLLQNKYRFYNENTDNKKSNIKLKKIALEEAIMWPTNAVNLRI